MLSANRIIFPISEGGDAAGKNHPICGSIGQLSIRESVRLPVLVLRRGDSDRL